MNPKSPSLAEKSHQKNSGTIFDCITEPHKNHRAGPQVDRRSLANVHFVRRCSQVCLASVSQVMRRLHAGVRRSRNRRQFTQVYLICIAGASQVYLKCTATLSQVDKYARN
jgi:hypothetical protein